MATKQSGPTASAPTPEQVDPGHLYQRSMRNVLNAHRHRVASGRSAWGELNREAYGDGKGRNPRKLALHDASVLASNLHVFLKEVEPRLIQVGASRGELCRRAFKHTAAKHPDDAKELHRLTLPPSKDPRQRGIRVGAEKYVALIDVVTRALGDNVELVADRLLRGTSLHRFSKSPDEWSDLEKVQSRLQGIVDDLDRDFDLSTTYRRTAELKLKWVNEGGHLGWPLYDLDTVHSDNPGDCEIELFRADCAAAADPKQAYYRRHQYVGHRTQWGGSSLYGCESNALQGDEFFYVPHAPLGQLLLWDLPDRRGDRASYDLAVRKQVSDKRQLLDLWSTPGVLVDPRDDWDETRDRPSGQTGHQIADTHLQYHFWLLAYPHPVSNALVPTLYQPGEEGGVYMLPLDTDALDMLSNAVWVSQAEQCNVIEWLKATLIDQGADGFDPIERNMRRTAPWLLHNPVLKRQRELEKSSRRLDEVFRADGRPMVRRQSTKQ